MLCFLCYLFHFLLLKQCHFVSLTFFSSFFRIALLIENTKLKLTLFVPNGTPTVANESIQTLALATDKTNKVLSK